MRDAGTLDINRVAATLIEYVGAWDQRLVRLQALARAPTQR